MSYGQVTNRFPRITLTVQFATGPVEVEFVVPDPTGELLIPPNCVNAATDRIAIATTATINANRFRARFVMG